MSGETGFLQNAYKVEDTEQTRDFYQDWAATYDREIAENGYATPRRCAEALAQFQDDKSARILDIGCGTGLSGVALAEAGFANVDGSDLSAKMLKAAKAREGLYQNLWEADLNDPFPFEPGTYQSMSAMGVLATSHAPAGTIDQILAALDVGGLFVFSLNDHTLLDPDYEARIFENVDTGMARLLFREYGDHLPGINMKSNVYVLEKAR